MANPRVLVVDDDPVARQYLAEVLQGLAAQVDLADCGTRAHALASTQRYELLIVDRRLPDAEAGAWLQALRTDRGARSRTTTAIVQSAELLAADRARLLAAGYSAAHEKPIPRGVLAALVGGRHSAPQAAIAAPDDCVGEGRELPVLDDRAGLESCGTRDILLGLRQLLHAELAQHRRDLAQAFAAKDSAAIDALIHRLTGAARYCGTPALQMALSRVQASEPELAPQALDHLLAAIDMLATHLAPRPA
jgi:two-component system sensor histidine kinase BarA